MRNKLLISLILSVVLKSIIFSQENRISFKVANVTVSTDTLAEVPFRDAIEARLGSKIESFDQSAINKMVVPTYVHSFVAALHHCFADHRPMVISPDMIWLMICQGLAQHIELHADSLRSNLVSFEGKKEITIRNDNLIKGRADNDWTTEFPKFADSIKQYVGDELFNLMIPRFSTTTKRETIAYQITLMNSVGSYFAYSEISECGIPEIIIEGTTKDWKWILKNLETLENYGLYDWVTRIKPTLKEFVNASKKVVNKEFWNSIYKWSGQCGGPYINGWICDFFPYIFNENNQLIKNPYRKNGMYPNELPTGLSSVDLKWLCRTKESCNYDEYKMLLLAGFAGIEQNKSTKALLPIIEWAVKEKKSFVDEHIQISSLSSKSVFNLKDIPGFNDEVFLLVEKMPEFNGGEKGLKNYIRKSIIYPKEAIKNKIEGKGRLMLGFVFLLRVK